MLLINSSNKYIDPVIDIMLVLRIFRSHLNFCYIDIDFKNKANSTVKFILENSRAIKNYQIVDHVHIDF